MFSLYYQIFCWKLNKALAFHQGLGTRTHAHTLSRRQNGKRAKVEAFWIERQNHWHVNIDTTLLWLAGYCWFTTSFRPCFQSLELLRILFTEQGIRDVPSWKITAATFKAQVCVLWSTFGSEIKSSWKDVKIPDSQRQILHPFLFFLLINGNKERLFHMNALFIVSC